MTKKIFKVHKTSLAAEIKNYLIITLGLLIFTLSWKIFLLPSNITGGGIAGVDSIISTLLHIHTGIALMIINVILLITGVKLLGIGFGLKTVYGALVLAAMFAVIPIFDSIDAAGHMEKLVELEKIAACLMGGALCGVGISLVFSTGGSTGGTDIIAMILNKYFRGLSLGRGVLYCDVLIIGSSYFINRSLDSVIYGYCSMLILSITLDMILNGLRQSVQFFIFSEKHEEIVFRITNEVKRGCTIMNATGGHSGQPVKIIMVVVRKTQSTQVFHIINQVDTKAFISQASVSGVYGEGFQSIN